MNDRGPQSIAPAAATEEDRREAIAERALAAGDEDLVAGAARSSAVALGGLFGLAVLYTLYLARAVILPLVLAILISLILRPIVRWLKRWHVPDALGALVVLSALGGVAAYGAYQLSTPAATWLQTAPQAVRRIETRLRILKNTVANVQEATDRVEQLATVGDPPPVVTVQGPGLAATLLSGTWNAVVAGGLVLVLAYFLLASGDLFLRKVIHTLPSLRDQKRVVAMSREIQESMSAYLFAVSAINAGLGVAVGLAMYALGMPNPLLWGAMAAIVNFVPYVGAALGISMVAAVANITFEGLGDALAPPATYLLLTTIEAYIVTPVVLSRHFTLNPVVVFLGLLFWGWIWGIPGALLAVPMLVTLKILCDYVPSLSVVGEFLGQ